MPAGKVTKATKKIKGSKGFGKGIATQKKIGRVKRSKDERMEKSIKAEAKATKVVPVLARHESAPGRGQGHKVSRGKSPGFQEGMKVDDFLESGFEQAMADMSSDEDGEEAPAAASASKPKKKEKLSAQLKKLKESDPAFYEYMQKTDQALLEFDSDEEGEEEDDEDDEAAAAGASEAAMMGDGDDDEEDEDEEDDGAAAIPDTDDEDEDEAPRKKGKTARAKPQIEVTTALVKEWERKLLKGESAAALKQLVAAFRCAVHYGDDEGGEHADDTPYTFTSGTAACHTWPATHALQTHALHMYSEWRLSAVPSAPIRSAGSAPIAQLASLRTRGAPAHARSAAQAAQAVQEPQVRSLR